MYVTIDQTDYTDLRNLVFAPQTDITGDTIPINEFTVDIVTDDLITAGQYAELFDDRNNRWAKYWITYAERSGADAMQVKARSPIAMMDGVTLPAVVYNATALSTVLDNTIVRHAGEGLVATLPYTLSSSFNNTTVTAVLPEQNARERLQWVCFAIGAYVQTYFNTQIEILPIGQTTTRIPLEKTYWRPNVIYKDYVTAVEIIGYSFATGTPGVGDEYVEVGNDTYILTPQKFTLTNTNAPATAADNVVKFEGVYTVNADNVSAIIAHVAGYLFKRTSAQLDAINNGDFIPGDKVEGYSDSETMFSGFVESCAFAFGKQAKARMNVIASDVIPTKGLTILYKWGNEQLDRKVYQFPIGFTYEIENPYIEAAISGHSYVFRPQTATVSGTMGSTAQTVTVQYDVALDLYQNALHIVNVDEITVTTEGSETIGVIT